VSLFSDGVVIGSALVKSLEDGKTKTFETLVNDFSNVIHDTSKKLESI